MTEREVLSRRGFLVGLGAAALVAGFDPISRRWVSVAEAAGCSTFSDAPALAGVVLLDAASRQAVSTDKGNIVSRMPCAVLRPGSVEDISKMIRYCAHHGIKVSVRGQAHTTHGQGLSDGLVIENQYLNKIHSLGPGGADVDTGVRWKDLVVAAYQQKLTPPVLTGYTALTVGGTLSVGGIGGLVGSRDTGLQVDHVRELEVVTGQGDVRSCSPSHQRDLFEAMLGGLGQCGVMTRAKLDLVRAYDRARTYKLHYTDNATFFRDFRTLLARPGLDHVYNLWFPPGTSEVYQLNATVFYDVAEPPNDLALTAGLSGVPQPDDKPYLDHVFEVDNLVDGFRASIEWDRLVKPWFDVWLPDSTIERYVAEVIPTLTREDVGSTGFALIFAQRSALATRPFLRLPKPDGSPWVFLFDILTSSETPNPDSTFRARMIERNDRLFRRARDAFGGVRYPIGTLTFTQADWRAHYGSQWQEFVSRKRRFDPAGILAPGPGIFA